MNVNDPLLIAELRRDEGVRHEPYLDSVGILTVGVGHNLKAHPIEDASYPLSDARVDQLLAEDLVDVFEDLDKRLPWWQGLTQARQRVLANMCFNLGINGLMTFHNTLACMQRGHYSMAAQGMLQSQWSRQVGQRANRLAQMMIDG